MSLKTIDPNLALTPDCDMWVVPASHNAPHSGTIDWYVNGLISKALAYQPKLKEPALNQILRDNELELLSPKMRDNAPILISSQGRLPTQWLLVVDTQQLAKDWTRIVSESAMGLHVKRLRFFAAPDFQFEEFDKSWGQVGRSFDLQIVRN